MCRRFAGKIANGKECVALSKRAKQKYEQNVMYLCESE